MKPIKIGLLLIIITFSEIFSQDLTSNLTFIHLNTPPYQYLSDSIYGYWPDNPEGWFLAYQYYYTYDNQGYLINLMCPRSWGTDGNLNDSESKYQFSYSDSGKINEVIVQVLVNDIWENYTKYSYAYDSIGNCIEEIKLEWLDTEKNWNPRYGYFIYYDLISNPIELVIRDWDSASEKWVNRGRFLDKYNTSNNIEESCGQKWDANSNEWKIAEWRNLYSYDENNHRIVELQQMWDSISGSWMNITMESITYNYNGNEIKRLYRRWEESKNDYYITGQNLYEYDLDGNETRKLVQLWDTLTTQWTNYEQLIKTYNSNGNISEELKQRWYVDTWGNEFKRVFFWTDLGTPVVEVSNIEENIIYPNPAFDYFIIDLESFEAITRIELIDISGKIHRTYEPDGLKLLIIYREGLTSGLYFIKIVGINSHVRKVLFE